MDSGSTSQATCRAIAEGQGSSGTPQGFGIAPGEYKLQFRVFFRCYRTPDVFLNIWEGPLAFAWEMPFSVEAQPREAPVRAGEKTFTDGGRADKITRFIHTFEEFMTAFDCHQAAPADGGSKISGTLHLQMAPWTKRVVIKFIRTDPVSIASMVVPIDVSPDPLAVAFDPDPPACLLKDGLRVPIIASQSMADMRTNVQIGPFPEQHIRDRLREMADHGINVIAVTAMPWLYDDMRKPASNYQGDAFKCVLDAARIQGMVVEGWGAYPFDRRVNESIAAWITGRTTGISEYSQPWTISHADPMIGPVNAAIWLHQFRRWGDLYLQLEGGEVPIGVEDTRGWMRQDVNVRHPMGGRTVQAFRDWNRAVADLDEFRTEQRVANYRDTLEHVRKEIPAAVISLRTEGGNVLVAGLDPADPNPHMRQIYFSQRRCAAIAEIVQASGLVKLHADYTTVPYTPSELRVLMRTAVAQGIVPMYFPPFDNMRDIAITSAMASPPRRRSAR